MRFTDNSIKPLFNYTFNGGIRDLDYALFKFY